MRKLVLVGLTAATMGFMFKPCEAQAQTMDPGRITALPQGTIGCALLGAEAVILIEGAAGVRNRWILLGTGALGLIGGGVGGYFMDAAIDSGVNALPVGQRSAMPMISTATLAVGLGLIIPTAIMYVSATMYHPEDTHTETDEGAAANAPLEESVGGSGGTSGTAPSGGSSGGSTTAPAEGGGGGGRSVRRVGPEALLNFRPGQFRLGVPALSVGNAYTMTEMVQYGVAPMSEWRVPVLTATF
jgi:hypothetical protein